GRSEEILRQVDHLISEVRGAVAFADQVVDLAEDFFTPAFGYGLHHLFKNVSGGGAHQVTDRVGGNFSAGGGNGLVEDGEGVAHGAVAGFGEQGQRIVVGFDFFSCDQVAQLGDDGIELDGAEAEVLAARAD